MQDHETGLSNLCRLCGEVDVECSDVFDEKGQQDDLLSKIQLSLRISISKYDGLPTGICNVCCEKLIDYTVFYQQCHDTQERLQEFISIESAMFKSTDNDQPDIKPVIDNEVDNEADDFYYEEAEDVGSVHSAEYMETEQDHATPDDGYNLHDAEKDKRSFAASEREKTSSVRNSSPGLEKDVVQVTFPKSKLMKVGKTKPTGLREDVLVTPLGKDIENSDTCETAPMCKVQSVVSIASGSSSSCTQISSSVVPLSEPPPLVKIVKSIVKPFPLKVPPLVPIKNVVPQKTSPPVSSVKIRDTHTSVNVNAAPAAGLVPVVRLSRLSESTLMKFVKGYTPKSTKTSEDISHQKSQSSAKISHSKSQARGNISLLKSQSLPMKSGKSVKSPTSLLKKAQPVMGTLGVAKNSMSTEPPPLVRCTEPKRGIQPLKVAVERPQSARSVAKGKVFVMTDSNTILTIPRSALSLNKPQKTSKNSSNKTKSAPLDVSVTPSPKKRKKDELNPDKVKKKKSHFLVNSLRGAETSLSTEQTEKSESDHLALPNMEKRKKRTRTNYAAVPYIILKNGQLVKLDTVDTIPLDEIPIPPVIVMHVSQDVTSPPNFSVEGQINFPDLSSYSGFPFDLGSGLHVRAFPETSPKAFTLSPSVMQDENSENDKLLVVQNRWLRQHKRKGIFVRRPNKRNRPCTLPEAVSEVEEVHLDDGPHFKCKVCGTVFIDRRRCEYHVINKHMTDICAYQCKECGKKFATNFLRAAHIRKRHVRAPDLMCSICGAAFRSIEVLKGHELRHTQKEAPFKCSTCGKGFYTKANKIKHEQALHAEKKVVCDICGEAFSSGGRLNEHRFSHVGGLKCNECGKVVNSRSRLRAHKAAVHAKAETFMFCVCGKKFRMFAFLHNHRKECPTHKMQSGEGGHGNDNNEEHCDDVQTVEAFDVEDIDRVNEDLVQ